MHNNTVHWIMLNLRIFTVLGIAGRNMQDGSKYDQGKDPRRNKKNLQHQK